MRDWPEPDQDTLLDILETWDLEDEDEARAESAEYDLYDDPIAAEAEAVAGYHSAMQDYAENCMADQIAAIEDERRWYAEVIWPKVKPLSEAETKGKEKIFIAKAKADIAKAKAKIALVEVALAGVEVETILIENEFFKPFATARTETALNKVYTVVTEANTAIVEADTAVAEAKADLTTTRSIAKSIEDFLLKSGVSSVLDEFQYNIERPKADLVKAETNLVKAKATAAKAKATAAKAKASIVKAKATAALVEAKVNAEVLVDAAKTKVTEAEKESELDSFIGPHLVTKTKAALAETETNAKAAVAKAEAEAKAKIDLANVRGKIEATTAKAKLAEYLSIEVETEAAVKADLANSNLNKVKTDLVNAKDDVEKTKAEASITEAKADLILVESEVALAKTKAIEAEAIVNLNIAEATLIESGSVNENLGAEAISKAQTKVDIAEAALEKAQIARIQTESDLAKAKTDLAAAITLKQSLNQTNRRQRHPPPTRKVHQKQDVAVPDISPSQSPESE